MDVAKAVDVCSSSNESFIEDNDDHDAEVGNKRVDSIGQEEGNVQELEDGYWERREPFLPAGWASLRYRTCPVG